MKPKLTLRLVKRDPANLIDVTYVVPAGEAGEFAAAKIKKRINPVFSTYAEAGERKSNAPSFESHLADAIEEGRWDYGGAEDETPDAKKREASQLYDGSYSVGPEKRWDYGGTEDETPDARKREASQLYDGSYSVGPTKRETSQLYDGSYSVGP